MSGAKTLHCAFTDEFRPLAARRQAFTLVELLVVIGIIAVLIGILLPVLGKAREQANSLKCMANLRTIGQALVLYTSENNGILPFGQVFYLDVIAPDLSNPNANNYQGSGTNEYVDIGNPSNINAGADWTTLVAHELSALANGGYAGTGTAGLSTVNDQGYRQYFVCPTAPNNPSTVVAPVTDYSCHPRLMPDLANKDYYAMTQQPGFPRGGSTVYLRPYKLARLQHSANIAAVFDASMDQQLGYWGCSSVAFNLNHEDALTNGQIGPGTSNKTTDMTNAYYFCSTASPAVNQGTAVNLLSGIGGATVADINTDDQNNWGNIRFRHGGNTQADALMMDGHVQTFTYNSKAQTSDMIRGNIDINP